MATQVMGSTFRVTLLSIVLMFGLGACGSTSADDADTGAQTSDAVGDVQASNTEQNAVGADGAAGVDVSTAQDNGVALSEDGQETSDMGTSGPVVADANVGPEPSTDAEASSSMGGWASGACTEPFTGTGTKVGDIAYDFTQMDQYGQPLRLHDYCDKLVLLIGSAFW